MKIQALLCIKLLTAACAIALTGCAVSPDALLRSHAYEGKPLSKDAVAAVFTAHPGIQTYHTLICEVDGKSYRRLGLISSCPSVVYLTPGKHTLKLETFFANFLGLNTYEVDVAADRVYEITTALPTNASSFDTKRVVSYSTKALPPGYVLSYKDIGPFMFEGKAENKARVNGPVSMTGN
jgi:hypothetical protein